MVATFLILILEKNREKVFNFPSLNVVLFRRIASLLKILYHFSIIFQSKRKTLPFAVGSV